MSVRPVRQDTRRVSVTVFRPGTDIPIIKGIWDTKTGGQLDSEESLYHPGAMVTPISLGGRQNPENITLTRLCHVGRDWQAIPALMNGVGKSRVTITDDVLDFDGNDLGVGGLTWTGTLKRCQPPPANSEDSGPAMIEIEVTVETYPGS